jgi:hypothetical protein
VFRDLISGAEENNKKLRIISIPAEIRTRHLLNINQKL